MKLSEKQLSSSLIEKDISNFIDTLLYYNLEIVNSFWYKFSQYIAFDEKQNKFSSKELEYAFSLPKRNLKGRNLYRGLVIEEDEYYKIDDIGDIPLYFIQRNKMQFSSWSLDKNIATYFLRYYKNFTTNKPYTALYPLLVQTRIITYNYLDVDYLFILLDHLFNKGFFTLEKIEDNRNKYQQLFNFYIDLQRNSTNSKESEILLFADESTIIKEVI